VITARAFAGKHYVVYGLARSGLATVEALLASEARVTAWDAKEEARNKLLPGTGRGTAERQLGGGGAEPSVSPDALPPPRSGEDLTIANLDEIDLTQFDSLVVTPGLPLNRHPIAQRAREAGVEIIGDIELFARARPELPPHKVVGITGTNGKSTTTALVHHILKTAGVPTTMGGNIGLPILAQDPLPEGGVYVLELSSYQIDLTQSLDCDVAVLLNITPDHLDRYESFEGYAASKARLFEMQSDDRLPITSGQADDVLNAAAPGWADRFYDQRSGVLIFESGEAGDQSRYPTLQGPHNAQNIVAATRACTQLGVQFDVIEEGLRTYPGLPHRMERIRERDGVLFVNDSKATNPTATAPALAAFDSIRWICGGRPKTDELDECAPHFGNVRSAYTIGEAADLFETLLSPHMPVKNCGKLEIAVREAAHDAEAGDTVLLSPACASFDQFKDFEDRGDQFRELVRGL
jgi:UDP-N-acetylmuramoylalanine--D-glutamate ligase